jgi:hypothetical protein
VLEGAELARFVYLDESGISNPEQEPWLVVGGVIVHGDHQLDGLYDALEGILQKVPEEQRDGLILHTSDIYGGNGKVFDKKHNPYWEWSKRAEILAALAELPERLNLQVTSGFHKRSEAPHLGIAEAQAITYVACLIEVEIWFRQNAKKENCLILHEDNQDVRTKIRELHRYYQQKSTELARDYPNALPFTRIREDPAFQEKRPSHPLILADFLAFMTKRKLMEDPRVDDFCRPWWKRNAGLRIRIPDVRNE